MVYLLALAEAGLKRVVSQLPLPGPGRDTGLCAPRRKPAVVSAEDLLWEELRGPSKETRWRSWTVPSFSGLRPSLWVLVFSWGDLNPYTNIHSGWVLLYWISSSLSPGSRASPFGTIIMSLLVVLQCEWLNAHGCIIYPQEASVSSRGCEFRLERRKLRGSEFLGISCQRLCLSQVFTTPTPTPNCSLRMNQER